MAVVVIESPNLSADQKSRIGERVITAGLLELKKELEDRESDKAD